MANIPKVWNGTAFIELEAAATVAPAASTSVVGIVQLTNSTSSTSTTTAATPNSVKSAFDLAGTAIPKNTVTAAGDILYASGSATVARLGIGTASQVLSVVGGIPSWATLSAAGADVQEFTASGSWVKPAGKSAVYVLAIGAGGGGASGSRNNGATGKGGFSGSGGSHSSQWILASALPGTVTITVGDGGAGGTAIASGSTTTGGVAGAKGGSTSFGTALLADGGFPGMSGSNQDAGLFVQGVGIVEYGAATSVTGTAGGTADSQGTAATVSGPEFPFSAAIPGRGRTELGNAARAYNRTSSGGGGGTGEATPGFTQGYGGGAGGRGFGSNGSVPSGGAGGSAANGTIGSAGSVCTVGFGHGGGGGGGAYNGNGGTGGAGYLGGGGGGGGGVGRGSGNYATGAGGAGGGGYILVISV